MGFFRIVVAISVLTASGFAQSFTGTISGTVKDQSGAVLPGVAVMATNPATALNRSVVTNERGDYVIPLLPVGDYQISAELPGFKTEVRQGIVLQVDQRLKIDLNLQIGEVSERLVVSEAAPLVDSETSSISGVIENRRVVELPLNGREFQNLTLLVPGALPPTPGQTEVAYGAVTIAGTRDTSTAFTLDGMDMNDGLVSRPAFRPSIDTIQEFKVQTSTYSAEFGRSAGGHVIVTTKSGSNDLHGTFYEFLRNSVLDAKNYFDPAGPIPGFRRNNFGGAVGGPLVHDRSFFFFNYEALRVRQAITRTATVPLPEMINGDFSRLGKTITDPLTKLPFPGNVIPQNRINPVGLNIARMFPAANLTGLIGNYVSSPEDIRDLNQITARVDHRLSNSNNFFFRYTYNKDNELDPFDVYQGITNLPGYGRQDDQYAHAFSFSDTHVLSTALVAEWRVGYNRYYQRRTQQDTSDVPARLGIPGTTKNPYNTGDPAIRITGYDIIGKSGNYPSLRYDTTYQLTDNMTFTKNSHSIKFGMELARFASPNLQNGGQQGDFRFTGQYSGNGLADALLGYTAQSTVGRGDTENPLYRNTLGAYLQDDWKVTSKLTLNLGIRYDVVSPIVSADNRLSRFDPATGTIQIAGSANLRRDISRADLNLGGPDYNADIAKLAQNIQFVDLGRRTLYNADHNDFAPRIGLAYRAMGNDKLVVRTGYGIFYNMLYLNSGGLGVGRNFPFKVSQTFNANATTPNITIDNPFPAGLGAATISPVSIAVDFHTGYVHQYNLGFQYQVLPNVVVDISYVGSKSTKLDRSINLNQPPPSLIGSVASRRPFPSFGNISYLEPAANANFNSMEMRVERRFAEGLTLLGSYTWSKSIDDSSGVSGSGDNNASPDNRNFVKTMRGLSVFDARQRLAFSYVYQLPVGTGQHFLGNVGRVVNAMVGGWELSGITTFQSGRPFTVTLSSDISNTGNTGNDRPNLIGTARLPSGERTATHWLNASAFAIPAAGTFGNLGRNTMTGPGLNNSDFSLIKNNHFGEKRNVQFRAEIFNILNHPQFSLPTRDALSTSFGHIFSTSQFSRQIQLGLKVIY